MCCVERKKKDEKKVTHRPNPLHPTPLEAGQAGQIMLVKIFLRVENINSPYQKLQVMWVNPASPTHFVISNLVQICMYLREIFAWSWNTMWLYSRSIISMHFIWDCVSVVGPIKNILTWLVGSTTTWCFKTMQEFLYT